MFGKYLFTAYLTSVPNDEFNQRVELEFNPTKSYIKLNPTEKFNYELMDLNLSPHRPRTSHQPNVCGESFTVDTALITQPSKSQSHFSDGV